MSVPSSWRAPAAIGTIILSVLLLVAGCADDPILGPNDGKEQEGGSYSTIKRLAPSDSTAPSPPNPERF
ncbi:MAG: hypothetical protein ABEL97_05415 [Salinibacter sp.]